MQDTAVICSGTRRALLIGINYIGSISKEWTPLSGPHTNVQDMEKFLRPFGYQTTTMTDEAGQMPHLIPSRANIIEQLLALVNDARPGDRLVFLYAGHSTNAKGDKHLEERDRTDEAIVPLGTSDESRIEELILDDLLHEILVKDLDPDVQLIAVLDTCHSATLMDLRHRKCNSHAFGCHWNTPKHSQGSISTISEEGATTPRSRKPSNSVVSCVRNGHKKCLIHQNNDHCPDHDENTPIFVEDPMEDVEEYGDQDLDRTPRAKALSLSNDGFDNGAPVRPRVYESPEPMDSSAILAAHTKKSGRRNSRGSGPHDNIITPITPGPVRSTKRTRSRRQSAAISPLSPLTSSGSEREPTPRVEPYHPYNVEDLSSDVILERAMSIQDAHIRGPIPLTQPKKCLTRKAKKPTDPSDAFPGGFNECNGRPPSCRKSTTKRPHVICFSACMDFETSLEVGHNSLTSMLISAFSSNGPNPMVESVIRHMTQEYKALFERLVEHIQNQRSSTSPMVQLVDLVHQHPQVSSMKPLDKDARIEL